MPEESPFDPADRSFVADPYPVFAAMRRKQRKHTQRVIRGLNHLPITAQLR